MFGVAGRRDRHTQSPRTGLPRAQGLGYAEAKGDHRSTGECVSSLSTIHLKL